MIFITEVVKFEKEKNLTLGILAVDVFSDSLLAGSHAELSLVIPSYHNTPVLLFCCGIHITFILVLTLGQ